MTEWKKVLIKDLGRTVTGHTPPTKEKKYYGDFMPFVKPTDISKDSKFTYHPEQYYSREAAEKYKNSLIPKGATCVVCIGTIGEKMTMAHCDLFTNQSINSIIPSDDYDPEFVYYLLKYNLGKVKSLNKGTASGREFVSKSTFLDMPVMVCKDKNEQIKIGKILSSYDSLIENYQQQIKLLEEAAQRLYKEWFVDLHFPGYENTKIVDGVPEGWEKVLIGDMLEKVKRTKQIPTSEMLNVGRFPVIDQSKKYVAGYTNDRNSVIDSEIPLIIFGDHTRVLKFIPFSFARGADGTQVLLSKDLERMPQTLFFLSLKNVDLSNYSYARHFKYLKAEEILVPSKDSATKFDYITTRLSKKIYNLRSQIRLLTEARDRLLPKLMSGDIAVEKDS